MPEGNFDDRFRIEIREDGSFCFARRNDYEMTSTLLDGNDRLFLQGNYACCLFHMAMQDKSRPHPGFVRVSSIGAGSLADFAFSLCRALYVYLKGIGAHKVESFCRSLVSVNAGMDFSETFPLFTLQPYNFSNPVQTLDEIASFLNRQSLGLTLCIEDFGCYMELDQKDMDAILSFIGNLESHVVLISKGQDESVPQPFRTVSFSRMEEDEFLYYMSEIMDQADRKISSDCLSSIYALFDGDCESIFIVLSRLFSQKAARKAYTEEMVAKVIEEIVSSRSSSYRYLLLSLSDNACMILRMLAMEGPQRSMSSGRLMKDYSLPSAQTVLNLSRRLRHIGILSYDGRSNVISDRFFAIFMRMSYGTESILSILNDCGKKDSALRTTLDVDEIVRLLASFKKTGLSFESIAMHLYNEGRGFFDDGPTLRSVKMRLRLLASEPLCPFMVDDNDVCFLKPRLRNSDSMEAFQNSDDRSQGPMIPGLFD